MSRDTCDSIMASPETVKALRASIINLGRLSKAATEEFKKLFPELAEQVDNQEEERFYYRHLNIARSDQFAYVDEDDILFSADFKFFFEKVNYDTIQKLTRIGEMSILRVHPGQLMDIRYRTSFNVCNTEEINNYKLPTKNYEFSFGGPATADDD